MSASLPFVRVLRLVSVLVVTAVLSLTGLASAHATPAPAFVSTWDTRNTSTGSSSDTQITLPLRATGVYNFSVEWGDGTSDTITAYNASEVTHTYATAGVYGVSITGSIDGWAFRNGGDRLKLTGIGNWGPLALGNDNGYFWGAENLQVTATDAPDLTGTTDLRYAFARAAHFNSASITSWDVSHVTSMKGAFAGHVHGTDEWTAMSFNQPIGSWDTSALTDSSWMFSGNGAFNQDLSSWDMSGVTTLEGMFYAATAFNGAVNAWDTSHVTSLSSVFEGATAFNQPLDHWNTASNTVLRAAFYGATAFNQSLATWDTSHVWHFGISFTNASSFNQSLGSWNMASATEVDEMLNGTAMAWNNYNDTLIGWSGQNLLALRAEMSLGAGGRKYTEAAVSARTTLVDTKGWPISGDQLIASGVPGVTISGPLPPATQVGSSSSTTITVQNSGTGPLDLDGVSLIGLGSGDYSITSTTCSNGQLASLATCSISVTFAPTHDGHRYTSVRVDSNSSTSPDLYDVSAFGYGSCASAPFASGTGTSGDPYLIMTLEQLNCINAVTSAGQFLFLNTHAHFRLGADIDAGGSASAFVPIGTWWYEFNGDFDGDGHVLSNAVVDDTNAGVFPWLDGGANVHDLTIRDARITTLESGGVLTAGAWGTTVTNVVIDGGQVVATKGWQVGGLAGMFEGTMSEVSSSATVVSAAKAEWASVGGLVGQLEGTLSRGYSTGSVTVSARPSDTVVVGGLVGGTNAVITDSFGASGVTTTGGTADSRVAGFVGDMWGSSSIATSYAAGAVSGTTPGVMAGFVGALRESAAVADVLWNTQTTGVATDSASSGSTGVASSAMRTLGTYSGWDIASWPDVTKVWVLRSGFPAQLTWTDQASPAVNPSSQTVSATVGTAIPQTESLTASGFLGAVTYSIAPALPAGLALDAATGVVSGTPTMASGMTTHTITATGAVAGEDTSVLTITISAASEPDPTPTPRPHSAPSASGGGTSPAVTTPGSSAPPSAPAFDSTDTVSFEQPAIARRVSGTASLVPASVAAATAPTVLSRGASTALGTAPTFQARVNQPVKLVVPGFVPGAPYVVRVKASKGYVALGTVNAGANGQLQLPVLRISARSATTIAIVSAAGTPSYVKVNATKSGRSESKGRASSGPVRVGGRA